MNRYIEPLEILRSDNGKRHYATSIPVDIPLTDFPVEYVSKAGDRWDTLAYKFYGQASMWHVLANANGQLNGSLVVEPGLTIKVPEV